jgi:drug/metabolite transporter (DMT)-like permease
VSAGVCILLLVAMNLLWSGSYAFVKFGLGSIDPLSLVFWRLAASLPLIAVWMIASRPKLGMPLRDFARVAAAGLLLAVSHLLWVNGIERSHATDASLLYVFEPVWGIFLAWIFLRERIRRSAVAGLLLAFVGFAYLSGVDPARPASLLEGTGLGNALVVLGMLAEGFFSIVLKPVAMRRPASVITFGALLVAVAVLSVPMGMRGGIALPTDARALASIGYLAVICTSLGYTLWVSVMKRVPVGVMLFTIFLQPIAGPIIAALTIGEKIDERVLAGGGILLAGMFVAVIGHLLGMSRDQRSVASASAISSPANA